MGWTLGGFVAGEGSYYVTARRSKVSDAEPSPRFVFSVCVAARDRPLLESLRTFLGAGSIHVAPRRRPNWLPTATFTVASVRQHVRAVLPFSERYLPTRCAKRAQFERWRTRLLERVADPAGPFARSTCRVEGCTELVRGQGLCRRHYYRATGR